MIKEDFQRGEKKQNDLTWEVSNDLIQQQNDNVIEHKRNPIWNTLDYHHQHHQHLHYRQQYHRLKIKIEINQMIFF